MYEWLKCDSCGWEVESKHVLQYQFRGSSYTNCYLCCNTLREMAELDMEPSISCRKIPLTAS